MIDVTVVAFHCHLRQRDDWKRMGDEAARSTEMVVRAKVLRSAFRKPAQMQRTMHSCVFSRESGCILGCFNMFPDARYFI